MDFISQTWSGVRKEFAIYKHYPKWLLLEYASAIFSVVYGVVVKYGKVYNHTKDGLSILDIFCLMITFYSPVSSVINKLVKDKESKFREYLTVNGMNRSSYQAKIAITSYIIIFFIAIMKSIEASIFDPVFDSNVIMKLIPQYFLCGMTIINMGLFLSTVVNSNQTTLFSILLFILLPFFIAVTLEVRGQSFLIQIMSFFNPVLGSDLLIQIFSDLEETQRKILEVKDLANKYPEKSYYQKDLIKMQWRYEFLSSEWLLALKIIIASFLFYLSIYLFRERDRDIDRKKRDRILENDREEGISLCRMDDDAKDYENIVHKKELNSALYKEEHFKGDSSNKTIKVEGLKKVYGQYTVLDDVSFTIYEQEIFCLLGHNGAGKTTLVHILTGLISLTEGAFYYNEKEVFSNISRLQASIGFCAQKDFAFESNTVYENLEFFAEIKKIPKRQIQAEIQRVLKKFNLTKFEHTEVSLLSRGLKRKLNIAIALLNDPNIIIMDEPTSGMDPVTRREYWEIIYKLKEEKKTVVITTQFLDEAEALSDRVAILSKGRLFAVGSVDYIKKKFGTGYNLIIQNAAETTGKLEDRAFEITTKIHSIISDAYRHDSAINILKYILPFTDQHKFSILFSELEKIAGIQMNLQLISLEEAFVKLEMNSDRIIGKNNIYSDEFKARLSIIPEPFYHDKVASIQDQIFAVLMQRFYRFKEDSRERWALCGSLLMFGCLSTYYFWAFDTYKKDNEMLTAIVLLSYSLISPIFMYHVSTDRKNKIRYILRVQGIKPACYWLAHLMADFVLQIPLMIFTIIIFNKDPRITDGRIFYYIMMQFIFVINLISYSYNLSLKFRAPEFSWIGGPTSTLGAIFVAAFLSDFIDLLGSDLAKYSLLITGLLLGPANTYFLGVSRIINHKDPYGLDSMYLFDKPWPYMLILVLTAIVDFFVVLHQDAKLDEPGNKRLVKNTSGSDSNSDGASGADMMNSSLDLPDEKALTSELQRLISRSNTDSIKVFEMQKTYPNGCRAIENLDFGIEKGQIFCLLGINGAGKTTCFEILTNNIPATSGTIEIEGQDVKTFFKNSHQIGVCCQINTLWKNLTVQQHLKIYARIRGLKKQEADQVIQYLLDALQLETYCERKIDELSMGTQRKICVALSVIGAPRLLFLDEPSTGIDPVGRNQIWDLVKAVVRAKQGAMILTTHYLQEAELVGDKLGILANGTLQTIGTLANLKKKYGDYLIVIKMTDSGEGHKTRVSKAIEFVLPEVVLDQRSSKSDEIVFKIEAKAMKFSKIFEVLEASKFDGEIEDFSIYTTTLEQIFVKLVKEQIKIGGRLEDEIER